MGHFSAVKISTFLAAAFPRGMLKNELNSLQFCGKVFPFSFFFFFFCGGGVRFFFFSRRGKVHTTVLCRPISSPSQVNLKTQQSWLSLLN